MIDKYNMNQILEVFSDLQAPHTHTHTHAFMWYHLESNWISVSKCTLIRSTRVHYHHPQKGPS